MKIGFGRSDLTPRLGVQLAGYGPYRNRAAMRILAPLSARAMAVRDGARRALVLSVELVGLPNDLSLRIRRAAALAAGCQMDEVFLSVTHTHSGPALGGMVGWGEPDAVYVETLPARAAAAASRAWKNLEPATWKYGEAPCEGIAVNRETDAGFAMNADFAERMNPLWRPARPQDTDPVVRVLAAVDARGRVLGCLNHFACHATVCGEQSYDVHGDFPGFASLQLEHGGLGAAIFLPGAMGDINPSLNHRNAAESRLAVRSLGKRYAAAVRRAIQAACDAPTELGSDRPVKVVTRQAQFSRERWPIAKLDRRILQAERQFSGPDVTDDTRVGTPPLRTRGMEMARLAGMRWVRTGYRGGQPPNPAVFLHGLRLGPVALLGCGLEAYHALSSPSLRGSPHPNSWIVSMVGGGMGYAPDAAARRRAGYSAEFIPLVIGQLPYTKIDRELPAALARLARDLA